MFLLAALGKQHQLTGYLFHNCGKTMGLRSEDFTEEEKIDSDSYKCILEIWVAVMQNEFNGLIQLRRPRHYPVKMKRQKSLPSERLPAIAEYLRLRKLGRQKG